MNVLAHSHHARAQRARSSFTCHATAPLAAAAATAQHTAHQTAQTLRLANAHGRRVHAGPQRSPAGSAGCTLSATCRICAVTTLWKVRPGAFVSVASFGSSEPRQAGSVKLGPASDRSQCPSSPMRNGSSGESNSARTSAMRAVSAMRSSRPARSCSCPTRPDETARPGGRRPAAA